VSARSPEASCSSSIDLRLETTGCTIRETS
jgi:hypothetical protein